MTLGAGPLSGRALAIAPRVDARAVCHATLAKGSKSFALAARLLPSASRADAAVLYTFCRRADDAIDLCSPGTERAALSALEARVRSVYGGDTQPDVAWEAFAELVRARRLPEAYPYELLLGMRMDVEGTRYVDLDHLLLYCHRVAGVVGLMMCHVFGLTDDKALRNAAHLGIAMQLTNICRDVAEDWERGRLYLPEAELSRVGLGGLSSRLGERLPPDSVEPLAKVLQRLLSVADGFYRSGDAGLHALPWRAAVAVRTARLVYSAIGRRLAAQRWDVLRGRAVVPVPHKLALAAGSAVRALADVPRRLGQSRRHPIPTHIARFPDDVLLPEDERLRRGMSLS